MRALIKGGVEIAGGTLGAAGAGLIGLPSGPGAVVTGLQVMVQDQLVVEHCLMRWYQKVHLRALNLNNKRWLCTI